MTDPPPKGQMYLFDSVTPPLDDGSYRLTAATEVSYPGAKQSFSQQHYLEVVGPRFSVPQAMVAGSFPPSNAHGAFQDGLPHIVLSRRTLPWERELDPQGLIPPPTIEAGDPPPPSGPVPWVALLVFEEGEYTLLRGIELQQAVPPDVFARLESPANITCDAVEADQDLVEAIMPSLEELQLLAHVRWVNVEDRELNTAGGDGYYAVVVANRLPSPGAQCRAVLVSLEQRADLVQANPPAVAENAPGNGAVAAQQQAPADLAAQQAHANFAAQQQAPADLADQLPNPIFTVAQAPVHTFSPPLHTPIFHVPAKKVRLVALTSWQFTCEGPGTFRELMQNLDVAMLGTVTDVGHPPLTDTGHLQMRLQDRLGASESVLYRGPLVPFNLTRDPFVAYHSADQARRVTPETGAEDISYAAAFEVGRLLAAGDARFAQAIMRWRRESYRQSARASTIAVIAKRSSLVLPPTLAQTLHEPITPMVGGAATQAVVQGHPPIADAYGLQRVGSAPGLNPAHLAAAWNLASDAEAASLLGEDPGTLGAVVATPPQTARADTTLDTVAADTSGLARLAAAREQAIANAKTTLGGT
ncbi:MAG: hypothetical protein ABSB69_04230 [Solirubrobacteraceae bacterium]